jgi:hypothetical protein
LAYTMKQHLRPRMEHRTVESIGSGMRVAKQTDLACRVSLPRLLDNGCHMRWLLHCHTLVVQRVRWVKHENGVLAKLPCYVVVQHTAAEAPDIPAASACRTNSDVSRGRDEFLDGVPWYWYSVLVLGAGLDETREVSRFTWSAEDPGRSARVAELAVDPRASRTLAR